jgi:TonB-dependent SusC/RagA subfamily outer membrane receptor
MLALCGAVSFSCAPQATTRTADARDTVTAADIEASPGQPLEMVIQRKVSGVSVVNVDGVLVLQIRNATTATGGFRPPLYVLNGVRVNGMPSIDPKEVETIKVLKDASAGIYGIEGAYGVIEITTKRAN